MTETKPIKICRAILHPKNEAARISSAQLRGYAGYLFLDDKEFHHHGEKVYHYPLIQYKTIRGQSVIIGLGEYAGILAGKIGQMDCIITYKGEHPIGSVELVMRSHTIESKKMAYRFITPWIALNEENYHKFEKLDETEQKAFLERILVGNVLSALKGLGMFIDWRLEAILLEWRTTKVRAHQNEFMAFWGVFCIDISLPDWIGLGKSVSKGFGTIERVVKPEAAPVPTT
ncbi:MAG: CRISPR-associated endonuclease Cas6 [Candidatus Micrarchaeota archaeon]